jgi:hypothetical protein
MSIGPIIINGKSYISCSDAARRLGFSRALISQTIKRKGSKNLKYKDGKWSVSIDSK